MVGVAGRSKGCVTCRRRKVKCDERKPTCLRCEKANLTCDGYRLLPRAKAGTSSHGKQRASSQGATDSSGGSEEPLEMQRMPDMWQFMEEMSVSYFIRNFFVQKSSVRVLPKNSEWLENCFAPGSDALARQSATCLATGYFASTHQRDAKIMRYSETQYEDAVRGLAERLKGPNASCFDNGLLSAAMALHSWELLLRPNASGWIRHAGGIARFIEVRGPKCHQHYPEHGIFMWACPRILASAFMERKRTFLEREEWLTIPWQVWPQTIVLERELWELRVVLPGLWEDIEAWERLQVPQLLTMSPRTYQASEKRLELLASLRMNLGKLIRWRLRWEQEKGSSTTEKPASTVVNMVSDVPRPACLDTVVWFNDPFHAVEILHYQSQLLMLSYLGVRIFEPFLIQQTLATIVQAEQAQAVGALQIPRSSTTVTEYTIEVARTFDYLLSTVGISGESFPMFVALRICVVVSSLLLKDDDLIAWITHVLNRIAHQCGFKGIERLAKLAPPTADFAERSVSFDWSAIRAHFLPFESVGAGFPESIV